MATRTIFFQISVLGEVVFYLLAALSLAVCFYGFYRRTMFWRKGRPVPRISDWPARIKRLLDQMIAHRRIRRRNYAGKMHMLIFFGMFALFIGTNIVAVEHYGALVFGEHWFYRGWFYLACKVVLDVFGLGLVVGVAMAMLRRHSSRSPSLGHTWKDDGFLALLLIATLTGFLLEGAGIAADPQRHGFATFSPVGNLVAQTMTHISSIQYVVVWWVHIPLVLGVIAALPYGRWLHLFVAPMTIVGQPERAMGALEPEAMSRVEETGRIGLGAIPDLDRWQIMSFDGCMECGRCTDVCPANAVGKPLDPKAIIVDLRRLVSMASESQSTDVIGDEALWACTNCHACVQECPALIRHVDVIDGIRRFRVGEGRLSGSAASMLRQLGSRENPWGLPSAQRVDWAQGLEIPPAMSGDGREILLWVGCAGAFDPGAQKTVRALATLLKRAGVKFTILGPKERCTGDPARRTGDEFLFQQLAQANVATLDEVEAKTVVTSCPHCLHTLKNEYPQFEGRYDVLHHTQYLARLVDEGRLELPAGFTDTVTYHDPCFLGRVNAETAAPRKLLTGCMTGEITEVGRRESKTFCCGAGGGRMWMEEPPQQRPGVNRANELIATGATAIAVGCPFCKVMVGDSVAHVAGDNAPQVLDVAEVMLAAIEAGSRNV